MHKLLEKVEKELENIADKGLSSSNLETTYKLIDIYKDIKESKYYDMQTGDSYNARGDYNARRDSNGRYMNDRDRGSMNSRQGEWEATGRYGNYPMMERTERYLNRMRDGIDSYSYGRERYRSGDSKDRLIDGIEMIMAAVCGLVEEVSDFAETSQEKEIIRKHLDKMKSF